MQTTPVAKAAVTAELEVGCVSSPAEATERVVGSSAKLGVVVDFGMLLPPELFDAPRLGFVNLHPSLLPRWRGAAPIQRAILEGDAKTGVSVQRVTERLDAGPLLGQIETLPGPDETAGELRERTARLGASLLVDSVARLFDGTAQFVDQCEDLATYARKVTKEDARIDWTASSERVCRTVRAFAPQPGAWCEVRGERVRIHRVKRISAKGPPGRVLDDDFTIACGSGAVRVLCAQRPGRKLMATRELLRGYPIKAGDRLS